jgi:hypothetical protein
MLACYNWVLMARNGAFSSLQTRRAKTFVLCIALAVCLAACTGPSIPVPPPPTKDPLAAAPVHNHAHGEAGPAGDNARLVTRYGGPVSVALSTQPTEPQPGAPLTITYSLKDRDARPLTPDRLSLTHERLMHLIVVSRDLRYFSHVHPEHVGDGRYQAGDTLPSPGEYVLYNEFVTSEGVTQIERNEISTAGAGEGGSSATPEPDPGAVRQVDGLSVTLTGVQKARRRVPTTYMLTVYAGGKPVTGLEPYLGAPCHVVLISADTRQFAHTHCDLPGFEGRVVTAGYNVQVQK